MKKKSSHDDDRHNIQKQSSKYNQNNLLKTFFIDGKVNMIIEVQNQLLPILCQYSLVFLLAAHEIFIQIALFQQSQKYIVRIVKEIQSENTTYTILYGMMIFLKILLVWSLWREVVTKSQSTLFSFFTKIMVRYASIWKQIDLSLTAWLSIVSWKDNLLFLVISLLITLFHGVYLQNYLVRKDFSYSPSMASNIINRIAIFLIYLSNIISYHLGSQISFCILSSFNGSILLYSFINRGYSKYKFGIARKIMYIFIALKGTISLKSFQSLLTREFLYSYQQIIKLCFIFCLMMGLIIVSVKKYSQKSIQQLQNIKFMELSLIDFLQDANYSIQNQSTIIGKIFLSDIQQQCATNQQQMNIYDPFLKKEVPSSEFYIQRQSYLRYYLNEIYMKTIKKSTMLTKTDISLDYCEFLLNQYPNLHRIKSIITQISVNSLNLSQRLKINGIQNYLMVEFQRINRLNYQGKLQIQKIIRNQKFIKKIQEMIVEVLQINIRFWKKILTKEYQISNFRRTLKSFINITSKIQEIWVQLSKSFNVNKKWGFLCFYYQFYFKNEFHRFKDNELINTFSRQYLSAFEQLPLYLQKQLPEQAYLNRNLLYHEDSCTIIANYVGRQLMIYQVSSHFQRLTGYQSQEVQGANINIIMNEKVSTDHPTIFNKWMKDGYISNQASYNIKNTTIITKENMNVQVYKYFKAFYSLQNGLQFICLLKINSRNEQSSKTIFSHYTQKSLEDRMSKEKIHIQFQRFKSDLDENIFRKDENLLPPIQFNEIRKVTVISKVLLLIVLISMVSIYGVTKADTSNIAKYSSQFNNYMTLYRLPVLIGTNYMKYFLKVGNQAKSMAQIKAAASQYLSMIGSQQTQKTIFNSELNPPNIYQPYYNYTFLKQENVTETQLIYIISSSITAMSTEEVNQTSRQFQRFISYLKPSYDNMMNSTKFLLHQKFGQIFVNSIRNQIIGGSIQIVVSLIFAGILFYAIHKFIQKMKNTLFIIIGFNQRVAEDIVRYWQNKRQTFQSIFKRLRDQSTKLKLSSSQDLMKAQMRKSMNEDQNSITSSYFINKKQSFACFEVKLRILIIIFIMVGVGLVLSQQIYIGLSFGRLKTFEEDGFFFLKFFPVGPIVTMGCIQKYYGDKFPNQISFKSQKYDDAISAISLFGNDDYIGTIVNESSPYYIKQKNYFFDNPCTYNTSLLESIGVTVSYCQTTANSSFKYGISSFLRYAYRMGDSCIRNKKNYTASEVNDFTVQGRILSTYVLDAINTWVEQFTIWSTQIEKKNQTQFIVLLVVIIILHFIVIQNIIIKDMEKEYDFTKKVYHNFVPQKILVDQKIVKQKFVLQGMIIK